jgi:ribonuclease HIII
LGSACQDAIDEDVIIDATYVSEFLQVNDRARGELERIGSLEFNIFQLQAETGQNELVTAVSSILAREDIFSVLDIPFETFMRFIGKIQ